MKKPNRHNRFCVRAGTVIAVALLVTGIALGARKKAVRGPKRPSYAIPNIAAVVMSAAALAIPCKRFRQS